MLATKSDLAILEARMGMRMYRAMVLQTFALFSANLGLIQFLAR